MPACEQNQHRNTIPVKLHNFKIQLRFSKCEISTLVFTFFGNSAPGVKSKQNKNWNTESLWRRRPSLGIESGGGECSHPATSLTVVKPQSVPHPCPRRGGSCIFVRLDIYYGRMSKPRNRATIGLTPIRCTLSEGGILTVVCEGSREGKSLGETAKAPKPHNEV